MLTLSTDKVEELSHRYRTLFEQSEKVVRIAAENFDSNGNVLANSEIITTSKYNALISELFNADGSLKNRSGLVVAAQGSGLYAQGADGSVGLIGVTVTEPDGEGGTRSVIKLGADNIQLEGLVTANQNFKILADGSMEATNGTFRGRIEATGGSFVGASNMYELRIDADTKKIVLKGPSDVISDTNFMPRDGATPFEYISIGDFIFASGSMENGNYTRCLIAPQIRMKGPFGAAPNNGYNYFNIDPFNGLVCGYRLYSDESTPIGETVISPTGHSIYARRLQLRDLPTDPSWCFEGQVYRDGNTLKIKTT